MKKALTLSFYRNKISSFYFINENLKQKTKEHKNFEKKYQKIAKFSEFVCNIFEMKNRNK